MGLREGEEKFSIYMLPGNSAFHVYTGRVIAPISRHTSTRNTWLFIFKLLVRYSGVSKGP